MLKNLDKYVAAVKEKLPDIEQRLNAGADDAVLEKLAEKLQCALPEEFVGLYRRFDGEDESKGVNFMAGFTFLSLEGILFQLECFKDMDIELMAMGTRAVREVPANELKCIPLAYDYSRGWLVMDLNPAESGKAGQIITVDYDYDQCYLMAESLDDLFDRMTKWATEGVLTIGRDEEEDDDEPFIMEKTGHLFNSLEALAILDNNANDTDIVLPQGFWQEYYEKTDISTKQLEKEKILRIFENTAKAQVIDCAPFAYMTNLKELIIHCHTVRNLSALAKAPQLKTLIFARCTFGDETLSALSEAPALKELGLNVMCADGLTDLQNVKTLKKLQIQEVSGVCLEDLGAFTKLEELSIQNMELHGSAFLGALKNLKILDLNNHKLDNLDFLANLKKLTEFRLPVPAENEDGLLAVKNLTKIKRFLYPVKDLSVYQGNLPSLKAVGMDKSVTQGFEIFKGSAVDEIKIFGGAGKEQVEEKVAQMDKYTEIHSYSW